MIPFLAPLLASSAVKGAGAFLGAWWKLALGCVLGALLCFPLAQCRGERIGAQKAALALERANTRALQEKARADGLAAERRVTDTVTINQRERELRDAIRDTPDTAPDAVRIRLGCEQLRRAGRDTSGIPACRGPAR